MIRVAQPISSVAIPISPRPQCVTRGNQPRRSLTAEGLPLFKENILTITSRNYKYDDLTLSLSLLILRLQSSLSIFLSRGLGSGMPPSSMLTACPSFRSGNMLQIEGGGVDVIHPPSPLTPYSAPPFSPVSFFFCRGGGEPGPHKRARGLSGSRCDERKARAALPCTGDGFCPRRHYHHTNHTLDLQLLPFPVAL